MDTEAGQSRLTGGPGRAWAVGLVGGEGFRLRGLVRQITGDTRPKQYVPFLNSRSLVRQTLDLVNDSKDSPLGPDPAHQDSWRRPPAARARGRPAAGTAGGESFGTREDSGTVGGDDAGRSSPAGMTSPESPSRPHEYATLVAACGFPGTGHS